jgi:hypothetical protein
MRRRLRTLPSGLRALVAASAVAALGVAWAGVPGAGAVVSARAASSVRLSIVAHLHYVAAKGSYLLEEGTASGPLAGRVKAQIRVTADISGSFTFYPRGGSLRGVGSGTLRESGTYASFGGNLKILGGTGRYAHASGHGGLYGVYDRRTLGVTVQTTGSLSY